MKIENFIRKHFQLSWKQGKCLQGCGNRVSKGRNFCSDVCRHLYDIQTWGEGRRSMDLALPLKQSLKIATNTPDAVKAFRRARKLSEYDIIKEEVEK